MMAAMAADNLELVNSLRFPPGVDEDRRINRARRTRTYLAALVLVAAAIVGGRVLLRPSPPVAFIVSVSHPAAAFPVSPVVEAAWGLRFTNVLVLADNGGVELRYLVIDDAKAGKIHQGTRMGSELPTISVEGTNSTVTPSAALMHFHHGETTVGHTYSIIYGNAGGVIHSGEFVTILMKDGLTIKHVEVSD